MQKITARHSQPLFNIAATRRIEQIAASALPPHMLMQRAGLAVARLTMALAPHTQRIWIACGPGNNGGDGFEAALQLHRWGKAVVLTWTGAAFSESLPPDAQAGREKALAAGVPMAEQPPEYFDFCIDALLGIGATLDADRPGSALITQWLTLMHASQRPRLAVDIPSGLNADTGQSGFNSSSGTIKSIATDSRNHWAKDIFTLSLLTLKPGLFTAQGRDSAGQVWLDDLGVGAAAYAKPDAWLMGADRAALPSRLDARHSTHKGSFGDVAVLGGESRPGSHMAGAALLAARAALHAGAGRVFVALLTNPGQNALTVDIAQPELMFRSPDALELKQQVLVCGCGGGDAIKAGLHKVLSTATRLVLDADALNAIAMDRGLQSLLLARYQRGYSTVLTPHPLEAARLLGITTKGVQADRLSAARQLTEKFSCVVVLKGSGSVIAAPRQTSCINASGNALLATAGTGDVLAGMVGAALAGGLDAFEAACHAVYAHGSMADSWEQTHPDESLTASRLPSA